MFTGIISHTGVVVTTNPFVISVRNLSLPRGSSVAIDGVCLTVTRRSGDKYYFDISEETASRTTLGILQSGSIVNIEKPLHAGDPMGGHIVTGHVDCTAVISNVRTLSNSTNMTLRLPAKHANYIVEKGSVAVDGVSLTVASIAGSSFTVSLIPFTMAKTSLGRKKPGDYVNIETDIIAKYVRKFTVRDDPVTNELLKKAGFISG